MFCQAHNHGVSQPLAVNDILDCFAPFINNIDSDGFDVVYDEMNSSRVFIDQTNSTCDSFSVNRPCGDKRLYDAIYNCMKLGNVICYTSYGDKFFVTSLEVVNHLPHEMKTFVHSEVCQLITIANVDEFYNIMLYT